MRKLISSKLIAGGFTLATVLTVGILSTMNPKHKADAPILAAPQADATVGCQYKVNVLAPCAGSFVSLLYSNAQTHDITVYYEPQSEIWNVGNGDGFEITWTQCTPSTPFHQACTAATLTCVSCPPGQAQAPAPLLMWEGFYKISGIASVTCGKVCSVSWAGWRGGSQCNSGS